MASFMVTLIVDSNLHDEEAVAEIYDTALYDTAQAHGMEVFDITIYQIYTGRK